MIKLYYCFIFLLTHYFLGCDTTENPPDNTIITLTVEDAASTEVWLKFSIKNLANNGNVAITRNDSLIFNFTSANIDTFLVDENLLPNHSYNYKAELSANNKTYRSEATAQTMDTTSHNFTFQTWEFGEHSSSVLYDVSIINENNIWAVGEIYMNDSLGQPDPLPFNAIHWDGNNWELKRISMDFRGNLITPLLEGVFAFSSNDIWFVGSLPIHGDGEHWIMYDLRTTVDPNLSLSKAWGKDSTDIYFVGRSGSIAHYNGSQWSKIESGTDLDLKDIWGIENNLDDNFILTIASRSGTPIPSKILNLSGASVDTLTLEFQESLNTVWFKNKNKIFTGGSGLFINTNGVWEEQNNVTMYYSYRIRGTEINNVWVTGGFGMLSHFNGYSWNNYPDLFMNGNYLGLSATNTIITAVGFLNNKAVITIGK